MTDNVTLDTAIKPVAKWLAGSALSALTDAGLARIGIGGQAKVGLFLAAFVMLMIVLGGVALMRKARQRERSGP
jgi:hypothetical protein